MYKNAFALVYASFLGPNNIPPLEACALGCPVVAANIPGAFEQMGDAAAFFDPKDEYDLAEKIKMLLESIASQLTHSLTNCYTVDAKDFIKIPGSPIAYWVSDQTRNVFYENDKLGNFASPRAGLATGDNPKFERFWFEVTFGNIAFGCSTNAESSKRNEKWYPCNSGAETYLPPAYPQIQPAP